MNDFYDDDSDAQISISKSQILARIYDALLELGDDAEVFSAEKDGLHGISIFIKGAMFSHENGFEVT